MMPRQKDLLCGFIRHIVQAAAAGHLYSFDHRQVALQIAQALQDLQEAVSPDGSVSLTLVAEEVFVEGKPLPKDPVLHRFARGLTAAAIGYVAITGSVTPLELLQLVRIVAGRPEAIRSTPGLTFRSLDLPEQEGEVFDPDPAISSYREIPSTLMDGLVATYEACGRRELFDLTSIMRVVKGFILAFRREANPFLALVPVREMDEYTFTHSIDVCILNLAQGMSLGFEGQLLHDIGVAAMLHDVGKVFVPQEILNKPGSLEEWEWEAIRLHTVKGAEYLLNMPGLPRLAVLSAFEHHLKYDLSGYPKVPPGWQVNLCSQMTMVSDFFDALRTRRVYRDAMDFEKVAGKMLELAGTGLNPSLTLNFLQLLRRMGEH
jgi:hypothetical protein